MNRKRLKLVLIADFVLCLALLAPGHSQAADQGFTTLDVNGDQARIYRDEFGVPHILADTNAGLFEGYGYAVAQDRLWQIELNRRIARGRLAEIFGASFLAADRAQRTRFYTDGELNAQFGLLTAEEQGIFAAYAQGINRYINEVVAPDPASRLPFEFHQLDMGLPEPWTTLDVVAFAVDQAQRFFERDTRDRLNQSILNNLIAKHGVAAGFGVFNDGHWLNDPDSPASVPAEGPFGKKQHPVPPGLDAQLQGAYEDAPNPDEEAQEIWSALGVPRSLGSHMWAVSAAKSTTGFAQFFGGPQVATVITPRDITYEMPDRFHEAQLHGGEGFNVMGAAFPGSPMIMVGRNAHIAWSLTTTFASDSVDTYIETLCGGGTGYLFNGVCTPFETRVETILVKGQAPVSHTVQRTVHGEVVASAPGVRFSRKRTQFMREIQTMQSFLTMNRVTNVLAFDEVMKTKMVGVVNIMYADKSGNIGYWHAGEDPVRPAGFDRRLPLPGDGSAEWTGELVPVASSINPTRGWLANWNNVPTGDYETGDQQCFGRHGRVRDIEEHLATPGLISPEDMLGIAMDISRSKQGRGKEARYLLPYLLSGVAAVPPTHPLAPQAIEVLSAWDGGFIADTLASTTIEAGEVLFDSWQTQVINNIFADEFGADLSRLTNRPNLLLHILDDALGGGSGVPPSRDYFNGQNPNAVISSAFNQVLTTLGPDSAAWSPPRPSILFRHTLFPTVPAIPSIPVSNRANYAQSVVLSRPMPSAVSILSLGSSGFIQRGPSGTPVFDAQFADQLELYKQFQYKPMHLFLDTQLGE